SSDCFTEGFAQFGELAGTKNHQGNHKNNDQLRHTKTSEHTTPPDAITLCPEVRDVNLSANLARRLPAMPYSMSSEQENVLDSRQRTAVNKVGMTMKSIVLLVSLAIVSVHLADEQQSPKKPLIGVLVAGSPSSMESRINAFQKRLRELGYKEGQNIVVEYHYAEGNYNRLTAIATDLVRSQASVIVTWAIPVTQVVKNATNTIPIVMAGGGNPVEAGLVESLSKPGGNITGLATIQNELTGKRLELLKEAVPKISRVAVVLNPEGEGGVPSQAYEQLKRLAPSLKVTIESFNVRNPNEIDKAFAAITKSRVDGLLLE